MADLGQVIGTLLVSLAHARRMADEQTIAIAEYYRSNPLLQGMTVPRVRVPELVAELPLILEGVEDAVESTPQDPTKVQAEAVRELSLAGKEAGVPVSARLAADWKSDLTRLVPKVTQRLSGQVPGSGSAPREMYAREIEQSLVQWLDKSGYGKRLESSAREKLIARVRQRVSDVAIKDPGQPPQIKVNVLTADIKERTDPQTVTRLRLVMREEGMEWDEIKKPDGSTTSKLSPE